MAEYNTRWFVAVVSGLALCAASLATMFMKGPHGSRWGARIIGLVLALSWIWIGLFHQIGMMAELNFMASVYGVAWLIEGAFLLWLSIRREPLNFQLSGGFAEKSGGILAIAGLGVYPALLFFLGYQPASLPLAGTAPEPTLLFTAGVLLMAKNPKLYVILVIPICAAATIGLSAFLLDFYPDYLVSGCALMALGAALFRQIINRRSKVENKR